ncbi:helix-turn-helix domain-containing protein [Mycolicibacterium sp.]|uniref:helix-turn-helix domain-containing protein n=1 Tax=Mycolicibacterium sp. TaxID=2320850 RepID=UPI0037C80FE1
MTPVVDDGKIPPSRLQYRLRIAREEARLDRPALAAATGLSVKSVSNAERGAHRPRRRVIIAWAAATGVPINWLENGIGAWEPPSEESAHS